MHVTNTQLHAHEIQSPQYHEQTPTSEYLFIHAAARQDMINKVLTSDLIMRFAGSLCGSPSLTHLVLLLRVVHG